MSFACLLLIPSSSLYYPRKQRQLVQKQRFARAKIGYSIPRKFLTLGPGQNWLWMLKSVNCECSAERCSLPMEHEHCLLQGWVGGKFRNKTSDYINTVFQETPGWQLNTKPAFFTNKTSKAITTTLQPFCTAPRAKFKPRFPSGPSTSVPDALRKQLMMLFPHPFPDQFSPVLNTKPQLFSKFFGPVSAWGAPGSLAHRALASCFLLKYF